jgi:hypothetical protein
MAAQHALAEEAAPRSALLLRAAQRLLRPFVWLLMREGVTFRGDAPSDFWQVVRSRKGRVSQCDCLLNGQLVKTCSLKLAAKWVASL